VCPSSWGDLELDDIAAGHAPGGDLPVRVRQVGGERVLTAVGVGDDPEALAMALVIERREVVGNVVGANE
jgi:hypothetical protein